MEDNETINSFSIKRNDIDRDGPHLCATGLSISGDVTVANNGWKNVIFSMDKESVKNLIFSLEELVKQ